MTSCAERVGPPPSRDAFEREFEAPAAPAVFRGLAAAWPAVPRWDPRRGGLAHLARLASDAPVEAMLSASDYFDGSTRGHEPTAMTFGEALEHAVEPLGEQATPSAVYLAQMPLLAADAPPQPLAPLLADLPSVPPCCVPSAKLASVSLWLSGWRGSRGSIHYDNYQNLLCVVAGRKDVLLWPPSETAGLYPQQLGGESGNHSQVNIAQPCEARHPLFAAALRRATAVTLHAGDALFIPEGFWHQVDSSGTTIAVNYWWHSAFSERLGGGMDVYYARRALEGLIAAEKRALMDDGVEAARQQNNDAGGDDGANRAKRARADPAAARDWADESVLNAAERKALSSLRTCGAAVDSAGCGDPSGLPADSAVDLTLRQLPPTAVQNVLGHLAARDPATLRLLLLERLSPRAAEALTVAFEEADRLRCGSASSDGACGFYGVFYSALGERRGAFLQRLLTLKERFAAQAAERVVAAVLGTPATRTDDS